MKERLISVVVVNYNAGPALTTAIKRLFLTCDDSEIEVIVVDNASEDGSVELLESSLHTDSRLRVVRNKANLGFAAACNIGLADAAGSLLLFLNPDCKVEEGSISRLSQALLGDPAVGMVGGLLLNEDGSEQRGARRTVPTPWRSFVRVFKLADLFGDRYPRLFSDFQLHLNPLPADPIEVEAISGACMLVKREAIEDIGPLDEGYFMHCEDLDWCMRFRDKQWKILFVPDARFVHTKGICSRARPVFVEWHKHKGMVRFYRKFFRYQYPGILMVLVVVAVWLRFLAKAVYLGCHAIGKRA